jgi:excisionase family DNA binding protein
MLPSNPVTVSVKEAATLLSISVSTIRRHIVAGKIASLKIGRRRVVAYEALQEFIRAK